jgi:hypothetical protein
MFDLKNVNVFVTLNGRISHLKIIGQIKPSDNPIPIE